MNNFRRHLLWMSMLTLSSTLAAVGNTPTQKPIQKPARAQKYSAMNAAAPARKWTFFGPSETLYPPQTTNPIQTNGRLTALATGASCNNGNCRLWVGTAGGGLWRTDNALETTGPSWTYLGHHFESPAIGTITVDPNDATGNTVWVGTGETNFNATSIAGSGLYFTKNGGNNFQRVSTQIIDNGKKIDFTRARGISTVVVTPGKPKTIYVGTATAGTGFTAVRTGMSNFDGYPQAPVGLYKTTNGGQTWTLIWEPVPFVQPANPNGSSGYIPTNVGVKKAQLDPTDPTTIYVTAFGNNIFRSAPNLEGGDATFKPIYRFDMGGVQAGDDLALFEVVKAPNGNPRIYVGNGIFDTNTANQNAKQLIYRFNDANVPASSMVSGGVNTAGWVVLTSDSDALLGSSGRRYCGAQCAYDQVIISPPGRPDTLYIAGVLGGVTPTRSPTWFSDNAGTSTGPTQTLFHKGDETGNDPLVDQFSHVDVHAIAFSPDNPDIVFIGSDGGVIRTNGLYKDQSAECASLPAGNAKTICQASLAKTPDTIYYMNRDLNATQLFGVGVDESNPLGRMLVGTQDNGTLLFDGSLGQKVFLNVLGGDGPGAIGFHKTNPNIWFASIQSSLFFTSFDGVPTWYYTGTPITVAGEPVSTTINSARQFNTIDRVNPNTQFTGYQHIWRTQNNGGSLAALQAGNCNVATLPSTIQPTCGDWVALGIPMSNSVPRTLPGTGPTDPARNPGLLTGPNYGTDRQNGIITAIGRAEKNTDGTNNSGTLWAATSNGRLFVSLNADNVSSNNDGQNVVFVRIDTPNMPGRFVSGLEVDPNDPYHAFISYAGYAALSPGDHVFEAWYDTTSQTATFVSLENDLGDTPVNVIAFDSQTGDLYAGFDNGVKVLNAGKKNWKPVGQDLPTTPVPILEIARDQRILFAGTHGLGVWYLNLD